MPHTAGYLYVRRVIFMINANTNVDSMGLISLPQFRQK